jgi:hypothetical protein
MTTVAEIKIGPTVATDVRKMSKRRLEMIAAGVLALNCYRITDLVGTDLGFLTTARLVEILIRNLRAVSEDAVTLEAIAEELEHRGLYAKVYPATTIQIFQV